MIVIMSSKKTPYRPSTKKAVAKMMEISERKLRHYLNVRHYEPLVFWCGYTKEQKHLTTKQIWFLDEYCNLEFWEQFWDNKI